MPSRTVKDATLDRDLITTVKDPINEPLHYEGRSALSPKFHDILDEDTLTASSAFNKMHNPTTYASAQKIKNSFIDSSKKADAIVQFFKQQSLTYSLKPGSLDMNHTPDSFLFDKQRGYCVHFASSFVTMARMAGIPSRIVTGYKADKANSLNNYLAVKERDAHAWAELYMDEHWVRFETTSTATYVESEREASENQNTEKNKGNELYEKVNLYLMYAKYQVETWILYYSNIRQLQLLQYAKKHPEFILKFVLSLLVLILATIMIIAYFRRPFYSSEAISILQPLLKKLKQEGYIRENEETLHQYFLRYMQEHPENNALGDVDRYYEQITYGGDNSETSLKTLKKMVKISLSSK